MMPLLLLAALGPGPEVARPVKIMSYAEMFKESDLVIIGVFASERADGEPIDGDFEGLEKFIEGVTTKLRVLCVLKGEVVGGEATVRHHRMRQEDHRLLPGGGITNGPTFAVFHAGDDYMLFLKKRSDGRYACVTGPSDLAFAVKRLEPRSRAESNPRTDGRR